MVEICKSLRQALRQYCSNWLSSGTFLCESKSKILPAGFAAVVCCWLAYKTLYPLKRYQTELNLSCFTSASQIQVPIDQNCSFDFFFNCLIKKFIGLHEFEMNSGVTP